MSIYKSLYIDSKLLVLKYSKHLKQYMNVLFQKIFCQLGKIFKKREKTTEYIYKSSYKIYLFFTYAYSLTKI